MDNNIVNKNKLLVNLGCGQVRPLKWKNYDSSINSFLQSLPLFKTFAAGFLNSVKYERPASYLDLRKVWPFKDNSVDVVYASHVFEHLSRGDGQHFISQSFNKLKAGGVIRLVVPDLNALAKIYLNDFYAGNSASGQQFLYAMNLHRENIYHNESLFSKIVHTWQDYPHQHKYMYDAVLLKKVMIDGGFVDLKCGSYGYSNYIEEIKDVECTGEGMISIYLEGKKP